MSSTIKAPFKVLSFPEPMYLKAILIFPEYEDKSIPPELMNSRVGVDKDATFASSFIHFAFDKFPIA